MNTKDLTGKFATELCPKDIMVSEAINRLTTASFLLRDMVVNMLKAMPDDFKEDFLKYGIKKV